MRNSNTLKIENKKIILTGCSGLLGSEFTKYLSNNGATVIGLDIAKPNFKLKNFYFYKTNLKNLKDIQKSYIKISNKFNKIDCLINNAALNEKNSKIIKKNFLKLNADELDEHISINIKSVINLIQTYYKVLKKDGGGSIINIGSIYGLVSPNQKIYNKNKKNFLNQKNICYTITKSALIGLTKHLAVLFANDKIRVNSTSFGGVEDNQSKSFKQNYSNLTLLNRMAKVSEFNGIIHYLISDASSYSTGTNYVIDGGLTSI